MARAGQCRIWRLWFGSPILSLLQLRHIPHRCEELCNAASAWPDCPRFLWRRCFERHKRHVRENVTFSRLPTLRVWT